jgi:hypothetical protein
MKKSVRWIAPLIWTLLIAGGIALVLVESETALEVTLDALKLVFTVVSTPFVLETTAALVFLLALLAYNRWRLHKEGDGWVYLMTKEEETPETGTRGSTTQRLHSMVLPEKPEPVDEDENEAGVIEGYLELGMAAQALEELNKASAGSSLSLEILLLRLRVLAANLDTRAALDLFHDTARRIPQARVLLAETAGMTAAWMRAHLPTHTDEAALWQNEAGKMRLAA